MKIELYTPSHHEIASISKYLDLKGPGLVPYFGFAYVSWIQGLGQRIISVFPISSASK
jgi:hypothetical protein